MEDSKRNRIYGVIFIAADFAQMRLMECWIRANGNGVYAWVVRENDLMSDPFGRIWSRPARLGVRYYGPNMPLGGALVAYEGARCWALAPDVYKLASLPNGEFAESDLAFAALSLCARLLLDGIADWLLAREADIAGIIGCAESAARAGRRELARRGFALIARIEGARRLCVSDEGWGRLARRDQTKMGELLRRGRSLGSGRRFANAA